MNKQNKKQKVNVFCAWCKTPLYFDERLSEGTIEYGLCPRCMKYHFSSIFDIPLKEVGWGKEFENR